MGFLRSLILTCFGIGIAVPGLAIPDVDLYLSGGNCGKSDISVEYGIPNTTCGYNCLKTSTCRGYSYHEVSHTPGRGRCQLIQHICQREIENAKINTYTMKFPDGLFFEMEELFNSSYNCPGNNYFSVFDTDVKGCIGKCLRHSLCQGFVMSRYKSCSIKLGICRIPEPNSNTGGVYQKKYIPDGYIRSPHVIKIDPSGNKKYPGSTLHDPAVLRSSHQVKSIADCKRKCDARRRCKAFEYSPIYSEDLTTGDNCFLGRKGMVQGTYDEPRVVYLKIDVKNYELVSHGSDCPGNTVSARRKETIEKCAKSCNRKDECNAFVWDQSVSFADNSSTHNCWLKSVCKTIVTNSGHSIFKKI